MNVKKLFLITVALICLLLGMIGVLLPILPTTPFFLATLYCFARSSERLKTWFTGTALYRRHLEAYVRGEGMQGRSKISIMLTLSLFMGLGFFMMARRSLWIPCAILALVWLAHLYYFAFRVRTLSAEDAPAKDRRRAGEAAGRGFLPLSRPEKRDPLFK